jgi:hypothetical protein
MPLGRKHLRRSRDAPTGGIGLERSTSNLGRNPEEVKPLDQMMTSRQKLRTFGAGKMGLRPVMYVNFWLKFAILLLS